MPGVAERGFARVVPAVGGGVRIEARVEKGRNVRETIEQRVARDKAEKFSRFVGEGSVSVQARL